MPDIPSMPNGPQLDPDAEPNAKEFLNLASNIKTVVDEMGDIDLDSSFLGPIEIGINIDEETIIEMSNATLLIPQELNKGFRFMEKDQKTFPMHLDISTRFNYDHENQTLLFFITISELGNINSRFFEVIVNPGGFDTRYIKVEQSGGDIPQSEMPLDEAYDLAIDNLDKEMALFEIYLLGSLKFIIDAIESEIHSDKVTRKAEDSIKNDSESDDPLYKRYGPKPLSLN